MASKCNSEGKEKGRCSQDVRVLSESSPGVGLRTKLARHHREVAQIPVGQPAHGSESKSDAQRPAFEVGQTRSVQKLRGLAPIEELKKRKDSARGIDEGCGGQAGAAQGVNLGFQ